MAERRLIGLDQWITADDALGYHNAEPPECGCGHGTKYHGLGRCWFGYAEGQVCECRERRERREDHD